MNIFEDFFNLSNDPMTIADTNGKIIHANSVYTAITGWGVDELKKLSYWELLHPEDHEKAKAAIRTLQAGHPVFAFEYRFFCKDGSYKWILDRGKIVDRTAEGKPLRLIGTHSDITRRKQDELIARLRQAVSESIEKVHGVLDPTQKQELASLVERGGAYHFYGRGW